jgi:hypothetical protein
MVLASRRYAKFAGVMNVASDGGKKARSPGRVRIRRKTIAQGGPDIRLNLW